MPFVDTHAHLADPDLAGQIEAILQRAKEANLSRILCVGTTAETSQQAIELAEQHAMISATVGVHPNYAHLASAEDRDRIIELAHQPQVVALGETGLDRYWKDCPWETQLDNFHWHWQLSRQFSKPVVIHSRDCDEEMVDQLREAAKLGPLSGVMHAFSGSLDMARACLELGLYISFAGMLTYKKSTALREVAKHIPLDRLLIETDSPYLTPEPKRGQRPNEPANVIHTAACLATCHQISIEEIAVITTQNAHKLFAANLTERL
jgi:TatD DNase family protein